jgi:NADPH-dependent ferric siderophore reductase
MANVYGTVASVTDLGPHLRRVVFDVPKVAELRLPGRSDDAVGMYFPAPGTSSPPPMEFRDGEWGYFGPAKAPEGRNYSVRRVDPRECELTCDFVLHQRGVASDWARCASPGEQVLLAHGRGWYRPADTAQWQLLVADLSGLPALARIIEELPLRSNVSVIVEVAEHDDLTYLPTRADVSVAAAVGTGNGLAPSRLPELVMAHEHSAGLGYCWFAGEAQATREVRKHLRAEHGWVAEQFDIVGYWRFDSETWDRRYEEVSDEVEAVYARALADGKDEKIASEEYDLALERVGL